jgi:hypothetical protein
MGILSNVQAVSLTPRSIATAVAIPSRPASGASGAAFRLGSGAAAAPADDVIDVDVLWEDADEAPAATGFGRSTQTAAPARPFVLVSPLEVVAAYRSASTTRDLPHRLIDLHA